MKIYITFGQSHAHAVNGKTLDRDSVAVIKAESYQEGRKKAFEYFGDKWCFAHTEEDWTPDKEKYFPRGCIEVD